MSESGGSFIDLVGAGGVSGNGTTNFFPLWFANTALGDSAVSQSGLNVAIGAGAPPHRLSIFGGSSWTTDSWGGAIALQNASAIGWQANASGNRYGLGHTTSGFAFFRTASDLGTTGSGPIYEFRIDNSGNVGIGSIGLNTTFASKLEIFAQDGLAITGVQPFLTLRDTSASGARGIIGSSGGDVSIYPNSFIGGAPAITIKTVSGDVGIGTSAPGSKLTVAGIVETTTGGVKFPDGTIQTTAASGGSPATVTTGSDNTALGRNASISGTDLTFASAIGAGATVDASNTIVIGRPTDTVSIPGTLTKASGAFRIDHPLDPKNKYLYHSFVESPDMMNIYNGNIVTDENGEATVTLPEYFEALNRDFRYQLTVMGTFAQAIVAEEINGNKFKIRSDRPRVKVSWQVTGVRKDPFAEANRIQVEVEKPAGEKGKLQNPEAYSPKP